MSEQGAVPISLKMPTTISLTDIMRMKARRDTPGMGQSPYDGSWFQHSSSMAMHNLIVHIIYKISRLFSKAARGWPSEK